MSNAFTQKEAVEQLAARYRAEAEVLRRWGAEDRAAVIERIADEVEETVHQWTPEWYTLAQVQAVRGWSKSTLRDRAAEYAERTGLGGQPLARKDEGGRWLLHLEALEEIRPSADRAAEEIDLSDPDRAARELARRDLDQPR